MGKHEFLTPKAIANRIKAKGLQKLRWYCQMCQKQCRDENGFKCHCMSESHLRQMEIFGQAPDRLVDSFSDEFEEGFMSLLRRSHRHSRVAATVVYNELIADRHHVHMNSTKWATLTEFVKYLGRQGLCKVEDTPKGWFVTYIDRDSETAFKERMKLKRVKADMVDEERQEKIIAKQIERAFEQVCSSEDPGNVQERKEEVKKEVRLDGKIAISMKPRSNLDEEGNGKRRRIGFEDEEEERHIVKKEKEVEEEKKGSLGLSALEELMKEEEEKKEKINRKFDWLCKGIVVKVMSKSMEDKGYYKKKGLVKRVIDHIVGEIEMLESKHVLRVDQRELETVIPQIGGLVRVVNGAYRGEMARLLAVDTKNFCAMVQIERGVYDGRVLKAVQYEDICKIAQ